MIEGGVYRRRDGEIVRIKGRPDKYGYRWISNFGNTYTDTGQYFFAGDSTLDLIELIAPEQIQAALDWLEAGQCYGLADHAPVLKTILEMLK